MKIVALSGSTRVGSYNTALLSAMSKLSPVSMQISLLDSLKSIPIFDPDLTEDLIPQIVNRYISKIREADGLLISCPEYAYGVTGVLKNFLDWLVATDSIVLKPVIVATVSTSGLGGVRSFCSLVNTLAAMNSNVVIEGSLCIPYAKNKFDETLALVDDITIQGVTVSLRALARTITHGR